jgi:hypothetical protein
MAQKEMGRFWAKKNLFRTLAFEQRAANQLPFMYEYFDNSVSQCLRFVK